MCQEDQKETDENGCVSSQQHHLMRTGIREVEYQSPEGVSVKSGVSCFKDLAYNVARRFCFWMPGFSECFYKLPYFSVDYSAELESALSDRFAIKLASRTISGFRVPRLPPDHESIISHHSCRNICKFLYFLNNPVFKRMLCDIERRRRGGIDVFFEKLMSPLVDCMDVDKIIRDRNQIGEACDDYIDCFRVIDFVVEEFNEFVLDDQCEGLSSDIDLEDESDLFEGYIVLSNVPKFTKIIVVEISSFVLRSHATLCVYKLVNDIMSDLAKGLGLVSKYHDIFLIKMQPSDKYCRYRVLFSVFPRFEHVCNDRVYSLYSLLVRTRVDGGFVDVLLFRRNDKFYFTCDGCLFSEVADYSGFEIGLSDSIYALYCAARE